MVPFPTPEGPQTTNGRSVFVFKRREVEDTDIILRDDLCLSRCVYRKHGIIGVLLFTMNAQQLLVAINMIK